MNTNVVTHRVKKSQADIPTGNVIMSLPLAKIVEKLPAEYAAVLAHEIRNPLSNIRLAMDMLNSTVMDDTQKLYLDIIMRGSVRINDIVTNLLTSNHIDELQSKQYSIHQLLDEVLATTVDQIMLKNIKVTKAYAKQDCIILLNNQKIKIALTNIIINAIDAMPSQNGELKLITKSLNGRCVIEIEDNGVGISKKNLKLIFKPYFTNKPAGLGLGLSTTLDILLLNNVRVAVQSEEGSGTRFILSFAKIKGAAKFAEKRPVAITA